MARELKNSGLAGDNGEASTLLATTMELILREGPRLAPFGERGEEDPHPASPKGRGDEDSDPGSPKGRGRKRPQPQLSGDAVERFLEAIRGHVAWLEQVRRQLIEDYEQSCREQIRIKKVVKTNYVKLEIVMRPGKPQERCLDLARQLEARLNQARNALGG